jgi:hypothetical protein
MNQPKASTTAKAWDGYTAPPKNPSQKWFQDTISGAFNPPTAESIKKNGNGSKSNGESKPSKP